MQPVLTTNQKALLQSFKQEETERQKDIALGSKITQRDIKRQEKIKELGKELARPGTSIAVGGFALGASFAWTGLIFIFIGAILSLTGIGAILGIPLAIIGVLLFLGSGVVFLLGLGSGAVVGAMHKHQTKIDKRIAESQRVVGSQSTKKIDK